MSEIRLQPILDCQLHHCYKYSKKSQSMNELIFFSSFFYPRELTPLSYWATHSSQFRPVLSQAFSAFGQVNDLEQWPPSVCVCVCVSTRIARDLRTEKWREKSTPVRSTSSLRPILCSTFVVCSSCPTFIPNVEAPEIRSRGSWLLSNCSWSSVRFLLAWKELTIHWFPQIWITVC